MKQPTIVIAVAVAGSAIAIGAYRLGHRLAPGSVDRSAVAPTADRIEPSDETAQLAETVHKLERRIAALEFAQLSAKVAAPAATAPASHSTPPVDPEEMKQRMLDKTAAVEAALKGEARDDNWAPVAEGQIESAVAAAVKDGAKFSLQTVRCMTSLCEVVLAAASPELLGGAELQLAPQLGELGSMDVQQPVTTPNGGATVAYRMFRKGRPRPDEGI